MKELNGWYESDHGALLIEMPAKTLLNAVVKMREMDADFGHTDMELELHLPDGEIKCVEDLVYRMVTCHDS